MLINSTDRSIIGRTIKVSKADVLGDLEAHPFQPDNDLPPQANDDIGSIQFVPKFKATLGEDFLDQWRNLIDRRHVPLPANKGGDPGLAHLLALMRFQNQSRAMIATFTQLLERKQHSPGMIVHHAQTVFFGNRDSDFYDAKLLPIHLGKGG